MILQIVLLLTIPCQSPPTAAQVSAALIESQQLTQTVSVNPWKEAVERSVADGVPLVVMFTADWCKFCGPMKKKLAAWPVRRDIAFVVVDVDKMPDVWGKYRSGKDLPQYASWADPRRPSAIHTTGNYSADSLGRALRLPQGKVAASAPVRRGTVRGSWTYPGMPSAAALERHLASTHNYDRDYLRTLSDRDLATLHDSTHYRGRARARST